MSFKETKLYSILHGTCPRCHQGKIYKHQHPYASLNFTEMNERCQHCRQAFEPEPDFYQGAMYVSYGLSTGLALAIGAVLVFVFELNIWLTTAIFSTVLIVLLPVLFRLSRTTWLHLFVSYNPLYTKGVDSKF